MNLNFKLPLLTTILLLLLKLPVMAQNSQPDSLDDFLTTKMKKIGIPGLQLAVIKNGQIVKLAQYGVANIQDSIPVTRKTVFSIASITKAFTGVAVMQLVEAGKLDLSKPVSYYLNDLPLAWRSVTIRQLLSHISGIPNIMDNETGNLIAETDSAAWAKVQAMPMEFKTGEKFSYNQTNYVLIGKVVDKLSGEPFTKYITDSQFKVVGMPLSDYFDAHTVVEHNARNYSYYLYQNQVRYRSSKILNTYFFYPPFTRTSAGLNTTAEEIAKWLIALQQGQLLKEKSSLATLWTPALLNNGSPQGFSKLFNGYAIGWPAIIRPEHRAMAPIGSGSSTIFVYPDDHFSIVILTNLQGANPEDFADEVAGFYNPELRAANGFGLPATVKSIRNLLIKSGFDQIPAVYQELKAKNLAYQLPENDMDIWGWKLVEQDKIKEAIEIFKFNLAMYPESVNAHDSYGAILEGTGRKNEAIKLFKQALQLNPKDNLAIGHLKYLGQL